MGSCDDAWPIRAFLRGLQAARATASPSRLACPAKASARPQRAAGACGLGVYLGAVPGSGCKTKTAWRWRAYEEMHFLRSALYVVGERRERGNCSIYLQFPEMADGSGTRPFGNDLSLCHLQFLFPRTTRSQTGMRKRERPCCRIPAPASTFGRAWPQATSSPPGLLVRARSAFRLEPLGILTAVPCDKAPPGTSRKKAR